MSAKAIITYLSLGILPILSAEAQQAVPNAKYDEPHRLQYHFSPPKGWMNDPNGMVYYQGEYHLFYQHYPDKSVWGPMHWGHAISKNLTHWKNLPIGLYPDSLGYIFSGSAVVDWKNTSGFGKNNKPPLVAMFTYHNPVGERAGTTDFQTQGIAYSNDNGRTWTKYAQNPVIKNPGIRDFRDPKVTWDEQHQQWLVTLAVQDHAEIWTSKNLKDWHRASSFGKEWGNHGGVWECPDFFQLSTPEGKKWVLIVNINPGAPNGGSGTQYFLGDFDGKNFILDESIKPYIKNNQGLWMDYGRDNYAGVTWSDVPQKDGRRILIGWMSNWQYAQKVPTEAWRSAATLPRVLSLQKTTQGYRLISEPVKELKGLRIAGKNYVLSQVKTLSSESWTPQLGFKPTLSELEIEFEKPHSGKVSLVFSNSKGEKYSIGYDSQSNQFFSDRSQAGDHSFSKEFFEKIDIAPRFTENNTIKLHLFVDVASAELFADNGKTVMTDIFFPSENFNQFSIQSTEAGVKVKTLKIWALKKAW